MPSDQSDRQLDPHLERWLEEAVIGGRQPGRVQLVGYDADWPLQFDRVREQLVEALGSRAIAIEHIGSTAVPGLLAKPIIDVLVTVHDVDDEPDYVPPIVVLGYELRVREPDHRMFRPAATRDAHVHVWAEGSREQRDYLLLRDWLRRSADDRAAYAQLKRELAVVDWPDVNYYAEAKGKLITQMLERAMRASQPS